MEILVLIFNPRLLFFFIFNVSLKLKHLIKKINMTQEDKEKNEEIKKRAKTNLFLGLIGFIILCLMIFFKNQYLSPKEKHLLTMSEKLQRLYLANNEKYFTELNIINQENKENVINKIYFSEEKSKEIIKFKSEKKDAVYALSLSLHSKRARKEFNSAKTIYMTNNSYPFYEKGSLLSGFYFCIDEAEEYDFIKLNCVQANSNYFISKDNLLVKENYIEI